MVRTQLQIDNDTYEALREASHRQRKSMSAVAREILRQHLAPRRQDEQVRETDLNKKYSWIGSGKSGERDISVRHDDYLAEDFK
jgi:hypothetical protein